MTYFWLIFEFFKTGLFAVGGGMATIPFLADIARKYPEWYTIEMLTDMIAVSESTPGPIGVNMATYVGFTVLGPLGAVLTTVSLVLPSFIVLLLIAKALERFRTNPYVDAGFRGLRPAVTGLIAAAAWTVLQLALFDSEQLTLRFDALILFAVLFVVMQLKKTKNLHPVVLIALSAGIGVAFKL